MECACDLFIGLIDTAVYTILAYAYHIYVGLTRLDLFGGSEASQKIYDNFSAQIYKTIAIVVIFIFAYRLLLYIMDPDGSKMPQTTTSTFIKGMLKSVVLVIIAPLIFEYMAIFQFDVVASNTIPNMILDTNNIAGVVNDGKQLAMITLMGFYHPYDKTYNDFVTGDDIPDGDQETKCNAIIKQYPDGVSKEWGEQMLEWCKDKNVLSPSALTQDEELRKAVADDSDDGVEYFWIICTVCGCIVIYFIINYAIAVGTRAVRLGFLQLIAPIPILMKMFDEKYYTPWFNEMKKTYLELFMRIAIISFIIKICTMVPLFIEIIFGAV